MWARICTLHDSTLIGCHDLYVYRFESTHYRLRCLVSVYCYWVSRHSFTIPFIATIRMSIPPPQNWYCLYSRMSVCYCRYLDGSGFHPSCSPKKAAAINMWVGICTLHERLQLMLSICGINCCAISSCVRTVDCVYLFHHHMNMRVRICT